MEPLELDVIFANVVLASIVMFLFLYRSDMAGLIVGQLVRRARISPPVPYVPRGGRLYAAMARYLGL